MGKYLILAEISKGNLRKSSKELASSAKKFAEEVDALLVGEGAKEKGEELFSYGVDTLYWKEAPIFENMEAVSYTIKDLYEKEGYEGIFFSHTWLGRNIAPRVSALLKAPLVTDAVEIEKEDTSLILKKPVFAGKAFSKIRLSKKPFLVSFRPNALEIEEKKGKGEKKHFSP